MIAVVVIVLLCCRKRRRKSQTAMNSVCSPMAHDCPAPYADLSSAGTAEPTTTASMAFGSLPLRNLQIPMTHIKMLPQSIGTRGFGEVFRGTYRGKPVAIKRLLSHRRGVQEDLKRFTSEIVLTASLKHPHLVTFIGAAWTSTEDLCMVTEFIEGGDLRSLLKRYHGRQLPNGYDPEKLQIALQVAEALKYPHHHNPVIIHRDMKSHEYSSHTYHGRQAHRLRDLHGKPRYDDDVRPWMK